MSLTYPPGMFVDRALITVKAGDGGDGCVSFRRAKAEPKGGPNGGDGGRGGDVIFWGDTGLNTLYEFRGLRDWKAQNGESGRGKQQFGAGAPDLIVRVPPGTMVFNDDTGELIHDVKPDERVVIARGGKGGYGNEHFKTSVHQTPFEFTPGAPGEFFRLRLELKLIADVGLVGKPNAGKSTLLKALTRADPKIANYPFTTLSPQLGIAEIDPERRLVLADLPGLIEGASEGAGLGLEFLRHIERTKVILHVLDAAPEDGSSPAQNYKTIRAELANHSQALAEKAELIALNKMDLLDDDAQRDALKALRRALPRDAEILATSGGTHAGLRPMLERLWTILHGESARPAGWTEAKAPAAGA